MHNLGGVADRGPWPAIEGGMPDPIEFNHCDTETVFKEVRTAAVTTEARSLWDKLESEINRNGVDGAVSYLEGELRRIEETLTRELARLEVEE
jgi:hypothetical protein